MPLHLIKLSVGTDSIEDLEDWIKLKLAERRKRGEKKPERIHTTCMCQRRRTADGARSVGDPRRGLVPRAHPRHPSFVDKDVPARRLPIPRAGAAAAYRAFPGLAF